MPRFNLVGPSYSDQSLSSDCQSTVNFYPEKVESGDGNSPIILLPTPGLKAFVKLTVQLAINKTHSGNFTQGQAGATYSSVVTNTGDVATTGVITVTEMVPSGLMFVSMSGTGWTVIGNVATRSDALQPGASYPALTIVVNVNSDASSPQVNQVSVSGDGVTANASDPTIITVAGPIIVSSGPTASAQAGDFVIVAYTAGVLTPVTFTLNGVDISSHFVAFGGIGHLGDLANTVGTIAGLSSSGALAIVGTSGSFSVIRGASSVAHASANVQDGHGPLNSPSVTTAANNSLAVACAAAQGGGVGTPNLTLVTGGAATGIASQVVPSSGSSISSQWSGFPGICGASTIAVYAP